MKLKIKRLEDHAKLPNRAHEGDLGFDLFALDTVHIQAGQVVPVRTGIAASFPEGWGGIIKARSSQGKMGINILGGVVDQGYTGEITVLIHNTNEFSSLRDATVTYNDGDKIAQLVLVPVFQGTIEEVTYLDETERGAKGFGSTGKR